MDNKDSAKLSVYETIKTLFNSLLSESIHTSMPGRIEKYDSKTRKATVLPLIKKKYLDGKVVPYKPIEEIPVIFYGVNTAGLRLPESQFKGQTVLLIFAERSLDFWLEKGTETEPGTRRKFDLTDGIAVLSLNSFNNEDRGGDNLELFFNECVVRIRPDGIIEIGKDTFLKLINENFKSNYDNHGHEYILPGPSPVISSTPMASIIPPTLGLSTPVTDSQQTSKLKGE